MLGCLAWVLASTTFASVPAGASEWELSLGASELLYFGPLSGKLSTSADLTLSGPMHGPLRFAVGARLGSSPLAPELFASILSLAAFRSWRPSVGVELGVSARADYEDYAGLLDELRREVHADLVPIYAGFVATPLQFALSERWRLNVLELHFGTHLVPLGRYVRLQLGIVSLGVVL